MLTNGDDDSSSPKETEGDLEEEAARSKPTLKEGLNKLESKNRLLTTNSSYMKKKEKKPKMIRNFQVVQFLGRGSQGIVFKCKDVTCGDIVAIKTIHGGSMEYVLHKKAPGRNRKFKGLSGVGKAVSQEIALLKKVNHPNLVKLLTVIDSPLDQDIHLVFEFCSGGPLRQLSDNKLMQGAGLPLPEEETRVYFRQLCAAIRYLHFHGIVHRDIKPSNLIIDRDTKMLKLTDLGIASQTSQTKASKLLGNDDDILTSTMITGTPAFLPPEYYERMKLEEMTQQWLITVDYGVDDGPANDDGFAAPPQQYFPARCADIWAAGTTLFAMMYGSLPVLEDKRLRESRFNMRMKSSSNSVDESRSNKLLMTQDEMRDAIVSMKLRFPGLGIGTSVKLRHLLSKMLEKDPLTRFTIDDVCKHEWITVYSEPMGPLSGDQQASILPTKSDRSSAITRKPQLIHTLQRYLRELRSKGHVITTMFRTASRRSASDTENEHNEDELYE